MGFFPESIMPSRLKDETQDVKGNQYVVSASDHNKHDEEIRAIQRVLGVRRPTFPASGFSGVADPSGASGFSGECPPELRVDGRCPGDVPEECQQVPQDFVSTLRRVAYQVNRIKDELVLTTSGTVVVANPGIPSADGAIVFPTNWPITTLSEAVPDGTVDEEDELEDLSSVAIADVSDLPDEGGYVTLINDTSTVQFSSGSRNIRVIGFTSLATSADPIYEQKDIPLDETLSNKERVFGLGTNVEIMQYTSLDRDNNLLLGVSRKQLGTSSTRHAAGDLVFKGRLSISCYPVSYKLSNRKIDQIDCILRSDGSIDLRVRNRDKNELDEFDDDDTIVSYAQYHALLTREFAPLPVFAPGDFGNCPQEG